MTSTHDTQLLPVVFDKGYETIPLIYTMYPPKDEEQRKIEIAPESNKTLPDINTGRTGVEVEGGTLGEVRMRVGKYVCPMRLVNTFTPMEFEEVC